MRHFSISTTIGALLCMAATARAEAPDPQGMVAAGLFATGALGVGVVSTVAATNTRDDESDGPHDLYVLLAGWGYVAAGATTAMMAYVVMDHLDKNRPARATVTVVPHAGPTGAGASVLGRF